MIFSVYIIRNLTFCDILLNYSYISLWYVLRLQSTFASRVMNFVHITPPPPPTSQALYRCELLNRSGSEISKLHNVGTLRSSELPPRVRYKLMIFEIISLCDKLGKLNL
jgi:hypothetical protein